MDSAGSRRVAPLRGAGRPQNAFLTAGKSSLQASPRLVPAVDTPQPFPESSLASVTADALLTAETPRQPSPTGPLPTSERGGMPSLDAPPLSARHSSALQRNIRHLSLELRRAWGAATRGRSLGLTACLRSECRTREQEWQRRAAEAERARDAATGARFLSIRPAARHPSHALSCDVRGGSRVGGGDARRQRAGDSAAR